MASTKRTWLWVILGVMGAMAMIVIVVVAGAIFEFRQHVHTEVVEQTSAEQQFNREHDRFNGQVPLIEFVGRDDGNDEPTIHRPPKDAPRVPIQRLRVLIYDLKDSRLIHVEIPGWLMRMMPSSRYGVVGEEFERNRVTIEDLERHGPGLVLSGRNINTRILVWSE